ncbi:hypothetical protein [Arthrobacter glacialis]|uniref:hypothetical protein n=1 Tax=Arthrobacter glacialis TaxID=1664 RepID=UPI0010573C6F|nr:hypothetical protein [Arthrobacter glacialis]
MNNIATETQSELESRNLSGVLWNWLFGVAILPIGAISYYFILRGIDRDSIPDTLFWQIVGFALFLSIPGLIYIFLGFFHLWGYKYIERLTLRGVGITALQLIPGLLVSIFAPTVPGMPTWLPIALGAAVSIIVVRTVRPHPIVQSSD